MKIKRSVLEKIVLEELAKHIQSLREADEEKKDDKPKADVADAEKDKKSDKKAAEPSDDPDNTAGGQKGKKGPPAPAKDALPVASEPAADDSLEKDVATDDKKDDVENPDEVTGGEIAGELTGKTIQSITMEPKSKVMPGAQEIVLTFSQIPEPLRILVTKTGQVKFFYKGLHNEL